MKPGEEIRNSREKQELFPVNLISNLSVTTSSNRRVPAELERPARSPPGGHLPGAGGAPNSWDHVHAAATKCQANLGRSSTCSSPGPKNVHLLKGLKVGAADKTVTHDVEKSKTY